MSSQLSLFSESKPTITKVHDKSKNNSKVYLGKSKKLININVNKKNTQIFWEKVRQKQAESPMTVAQADYIVENLLLWDSYRLESELDAVGASDGEKFFYINYLYELARKHREVFTTLWQIEDED